MFCSRFNYTGYLGGSHFFCAKPFEIKKVEACKNAEEILALAKEEGVTLSDEQLEAVSGGCGIKDPYEYVVDETLEQTCPYKVDTHCYNCGSHNFTQTFETHKTITGTKVHCKCNDCGNTWTVNIA